MKPAPVSFIKIKFLPLIFNDKNILSEYKISIILDENLLINTKLNDNKIFELD